MSKEFYVADVGINPILHELRVNGKPIGTVHFGTGSNVNDKSIMHLNLDPVFYMSKFRVTEVNFNGSRIYVRLQKVDEDK